MKAPLLPSLPFALIRGEVEGRTARFYAHREAGCYRLEAGVEVVLVEEVEIALRGLVGAFERLADFVEASAKARVAGAVHCARIGGDALVVEECDGGDSVCDAMRWMSAN